MLTRPDRRSPMRRRGWWICLLGSASLIAGCEKPDKLAEVTHATATTEARTVSTADWQVAGNGLALFAGSRVKTPHAGPAVVFTNGVQMMLGETTEIEIGAPEAGHAAARLQLLSGAVDVDNAKGVGVVVDGAGEPSLAVSGGAVGTFKIVLVRESPPSERLIVHALSGLEVRAGDTTLSLVAGDQVALDDGALVRLGAFFEFFAEPNAAKLTKRWGDVTLVGFTRGVKIRRAGTSVWVDARPDMQIGVDDEVMTDAGADVTLRYEGGAEIDVMPGTIAVFRERRTDEHGVHKVASLLIRSGQVVARADAEGNVTFRILTPTGLVRAAGRPDAPLEAVVGVAGDGRVQVESKFGKVDVITRGESTGVAPRQTVEISAEGGLTIRRPAPAREARSRPEPLPAPVLVGESTRRLSAHSPAATLAWKEVRRARKYQLQVGRNERFTRPLLDEKLAARSFEFVDQNEPTIYWRVRAIDGKGNPGPFSPVHRIDFAAGGDRPAGLMLGAGRAPAGTAKLQILAPARDAVVHTDKISVRGRAVGATGLRVNNTPAEVGADGSFSATVPLIEGLNQIVVEARDGDGRMSHDARNVFCKLGEALPARE